MFEFNIARFKNYAVPDRIHSLVFYSQVMLWGVLHSQEVLVQFKLYTNISDNAWPGFKKKCRHSISSG